MLQRPGDRLGFAPDGRRIAVWLGDLGLQVVSIDSGSVVATLHPPLDVAEIAWHPDGRSLAVCGDNSNCRIYLLDVSTGRELAVMQGHFARPTTLRFSQSDEEKGTGPFTD